MHNSLVNCRVLHSTQCLCQHRQLFSMGSAAQHLGGCIKMRASLRWYRLQLIPGCSESLQLQMNPEAT